MAVTAPIALACKAALAVLLVAAGAAKLADLRGFAATVRLFLPAWAGAGTGAGTLAGAGAFGGAGVRPRLSYAAAIAVAAAEIAAGAASLSSPLAGWMNVAVLALCCAF